VLWRSKATPLMLSAIRRTSSSYPSGSCFVELASEGDAIDVNDVAALPVRSWTDAHGKTMMTAILRR